ncbi:efflux RND transporter permease subunit [Magnetococcales bacterium HHB-1]
MSNQTNSNLGVAGKMARAFIQSPLSPLFLFASLAMGLLGLVLTPRQEDPQISVPMVDIFVRYTGASSQQVATLVTDPLERIMSEIHGVKHVYSASMREQAMITVEYHVGEELEDSLVKLYDRIKHNMDKMPPGVMPPLVKSRAVDDVPIVALTLWSDELDDGTLRTMSMDMLQWLKEVPDTSQGFVVGGRKEQIRIEVMPERLAGFGISLDQIAQTIKTANSEQGIGNVESGDQGFKVYTGAFLKNAAEIARLVVGMHNNKPVYVSDVAKVFAGPEETKRSVSYYTGQSYTDNTPSADGAPAVTVAIAKKKGSNGVTVANNILKRVEELKKNNMIPSNVHVAVTRNYGQTANEKVNELLFKLFVATAAVTLLVWFSLGFRPAVVTLVVIPIVILMTVFSAYLMDYTIDRVSLFALIFSIGILVDDAIVVVENIYRRWLLQDSCCVNISVDAVREVGNPTILATFTVIAALLPMGFVRGMMGPYMEPIPALGSAAMLFSLFAAFIFTPWLAQIIKPSMRSLHFHSEKEHNQAEKLERFYRWLIPPLITSKFKGYAFLVSLFVMFFLSMALFYTTDVTVKILPLDNKPEFNVVINLPEGSALPKTTNVARELSEALKKNIPEVVALQTYVGTASPYNFNGMVRHYYLREDPWQADIQVQLVHKNDRERTSHDLAVAARHLLTPLAKKHGAKIQVVEMPPGPPVLQSVVAEVTGPTDTIRRQVANDMTNLFEKAEVIVDVDNYMQDDYEIWKFEVDTEKAVRRGISVDTINRNLGMAMGGARLGDIKKGHMLEPTYIIIQVPLEVRAKITSLADLPIMTPRGTTIPLGELGRFVKAVQDPIIYHKDLRPVEYVTGEVEGRLDAPIYGMSEVEDMLQSYTTPDNQNISGEYMGAPETYSKSGFEWTGEWTVTYETFRDMGLAFGAALILIYMLVVWEFGNFTLPAIIMAPIPLTLLGIVPGHWLMDAKFTATSMIGFIALAGIIVRNSILLVDFSQQEVLKGVPVRDAVILACKARTRPILITAFALVAGSSVILTDFIFQGMAISLLFGALVSTLLTLLVIPLGCISAKNSFVKPDADGLPPEFVALNEPGYEDDAIKKRTEKAIEFGKKKAEPAKKKSTESSKEDLKVASEKKESSEKKQEVTSAPVTEVAPAKEESKAKEAPAKEEPKAEETPAKEEPKAEETPAKEEPKAEETPAKEESKAKEAPAKEEPKAEETPAKEEPKAKEAPAKEEPKAEETPAKEEPKAEETPAKEESKAEETPAKEEPKAEATPAKKTSTRKTPAKRATRAKKSTTTTAQKKASTAAKSQKKATTAKKRRGIRLKPSE